MVRVQGAMAPAHRLLLILLLLVALHVRAAWAAPWRVQGADEGGGNGYPASRLDVGLEPLGHPGGPPRAKYQAEGGRKSPAPSEVVRQMLEELKRAHETDREAVQKEALPEGSGGSLPVSAEEREAMRAAGTPVLPRPREDHHSRVYGFPRADSDVLGETTTKVYNPQNIASGFCHQDVRRRCMIGTAVTVVSLPLAIVLCCVWLHRRRKRKERLSAASGAQRETGSRPSRPDSRTSRPGIPESRTSRPSSPESWTQRQQPPHRPQTPARPPSPRPPRPPSPSPEALLSRNQPSTLQPQPQQKRPPPTPEPAAPALRQGLKVARDHLAVDLLSWDTQEKREAIKNIARDTSLTSKCTGGKTKVLANSWALDGP
ncbi:uncharacterized protein LJ206_014479 [Theristicus caerulescens]